MMCMPILPCHFVSSELEAAKLRSKVKNAVFGQDEYTAYLRSGHEVATAFIFATQALL